MNLLMLVFVIAGYAKGYNLAFNIARTYSDEVKLIEEVPLYTPNMQRFATLYVFESSNDTISVITGDNENSRPVYEYGKGIYRFMLFNRVDYRTARVIYTGYSTFFLYNGRFYDTRYFKYVSSFYVKSLFAKGIDFKDYSMKWQAYLEKGFKLDEYNEIEGVPAYLWSYGCSPTASAMILGYWDKRGYGRLIDYYFNHYDVVLREVVANVPNVQTELAIYMNADTTTGYTDWAPISTGTQDCANIANGYSFISNWVYDTIVYDTACAFDTAYMYLKEEIDSGRPVHWAVGNYLDPYGRIIEHSTCALGYQVTGADTFVLLHNTWDYGTWAWPLYTSDSTYIAMYNVIPGGVEQGNINSIEATGPIVNNLYFKINLSFDDTTMINRAELYHTGDNADSWVFDGEVSPVSEILSKMDFGGYTDVRFMVKTYNQNGDLISSEASYNPVGIIYPEYDGIFNAKAFCSVSPEPRTINHIDNKILVGTTYGIVEVASYDSILEQNAVFGGAALSSSQYDSIIIYGRYSSGFDIYNKNIQIYHDTTEGYVVDVAIDSQRACVFERDLGFRIINYTQGFTQDTVPASGSYFMTGDINQNYVYTGTLRSGFLVYDIANQQFVDTVGQGRVYDMELSKDDSLLYVLYAGYLKVYNITSPDSPLLQDSIPVSGSVHIRAHKNRLFAIRGNSGVDIYTFLPDGYVRSSIYNIGNVKDIFGEDTTLYIATSDGLILKVDYLGSEVKERINTLSGKKDVFLLKGDVLNLESDIKGRYAVYDLNGRCIKSGDVKGGVINLESLPRGTYVVRLQNSTLRLIKIN